MGSCLSKIQEDLYVVRFAPDRDQQSFTLSRRIERQLRSQEAEDRSTIKLLLLGSGNSGKSTVMKQFKIIHKRGFTTEERKVYRDAIWKSAIESLQSFARLRAEYIAEHGSFEGEEPDHSLEPYFQMLLYRVRPDQALFEEVEIPVPEDFIQNEKNQRERLQVNNSPMLAKTIVLSSPITDHKSATFDEISKRKSGNISVAQQQQQQQSPGGPVQDPQQNVEKKGEPSGSEEDSQSSSNSSPDGFAQPPGGPPSESVDQNDNEKLHQPVFDDPPPRTPEKKTSSSMSRKRKPSLNLEAEELGLDPPKSVNGEIASNNEENDEAKSGSVEEQKKKERRRKAKSFSKDDGELDTRTRKRSFASPEEEEAYRKERKKKKKIKKNKKKLEDPRISGSFDVASVNTGNVDRRKILSGSSVESFSSENNPKKEFISIKWQKITVAQLLQKVWVDPIIQHLYELERKNPQLETPIGYIMDEMDTIADPGYQPRNEDILNARKRTSGVNLLEFEAFGAKFLLIDVGGQRTERRKWLAHFDIVDAVIFVVGLDQYDQTMIEDGVTNRLRDSLELFEEMCSSPWFRTSSFLLFLNKSDIFKTKIRQVPLTVCFRNYQGDPHDFDQTTKYIIKRFQFIHNHHVNLYRQEMQERRKTQPMPHVYPYMTCATDTESMRFVIDACQDILLRTEMAQWGFFDF